ncbi:MAG: inositol monophosphatase family protein [Actinomycetota bacterium]|nr:inositol monophosphatase family protein [Actinomycetota bacterium]
MGRIIDCDRVLADLHAAADAVAAALDGHADWGPSGNRPGQYASDVVADGAVSAALLPLGYGLLSEESEVVEPGEGRPMVVADPLDGSTNASRGIQHYAASLCAADGEGPVAAVVLNLAIGTRYEAVRGGGARRDGVALWRDDLPALSEAIVGVSGLPASNPGWAQFRCLGAAALDLCAVADGTLDAYVDCVTDAHGVWDYLGALLVCREAGVIVEDAKGRDLCVLDRSVRRTPVAAVGSALHEALSGGA